MTKDERSFRMRRVQNAKTFEERSAIAKKGRATVVARYKYLRLEFGEFVFREWPNARVNDRLL